MSQICISQICREMMPPDFFLCSFGTWYIRNVGERMKATLNEAKIK